jgi:hypothetical protein
MSLRFGAGSRPLAIFAVVVVVVMVVVAICCGPGWRRLTVAMLNSRMVECGLHIYVCVCMCVCVWQMGVVRVVAAACARARRGWVAWFPAADPSNLMVVVVVERGLGAPRVAREGVPAAGDVQRGYDPAQGQELEHPHQHLVGQQRLVGDFIVVVLPPPLSYLRLPLLLFSFHLSSLSC